MRAPDDADFRWGELMEGQDRAHAWPRNTALRQAQHCVTQHARSDTRRCYDSPNLRLRLTRHCSAGGPFRTPADFKQIGGSWASLGGRLHPPEGGGIEGEVSCRRVRSVGARIAAVRGCPQSSRAFQSPREAPPPTFPPHTHLRGALGDRISSQRPSCRAFPP